MKKKLLSILLILTMVLTLLPGTALAATATLDRAWTSDQDYTLESPAPWNLDELKQVVDVKDPRSVAAYWVWAVNRLVDNYDDGMDMMKYLFADIEPYGRGFTEGGMSGKAGWDTYFNERLKSGDYKWLPRAYFKNAKADDGFAFHQPLTVALHYHAPNTETINDQTLSQLGRLNIVYWVKSNAAGNQVNITLSKFDGGDRWYVTSGTSSTALFYDQRSGVSSAVLAAAKTAAADTSTQAEHDARYGGGGSDKPLPETIYNPAPGSTDAGKPDDAGNANPFHDVSRSDYYYEPILWAVEQGVTSGTSSTTFSPDSLCKTEQILTFIWNAIGKRAPAGASPFTDVKESDWFSTPVTWAYNAGLVSGTTFGPGTNCTRAMAVTYLWKAAGSPDIAATGQFTDVPADADYAQAVAWAVSKGITAGTSSTTFSPDSVCTRGQIMTFLYNDLVG